MTVLHRMILCAGGVALVGGLAQPAAFGEPRYSLDELNSHPYRFIPPAGHAAQAPGSPRHFVPGYGYRIPGFGLSIIVNQNMPPSRAGYHYGIRTRGMRDPSRYRYLPDSYGGPWYHPGWSANTTLRPNQW